MHPMINIALRAARKAGNTIERALENIDKINIKKKSSNNFVTEIDRAAEQDILSILQKAYPNHSFVSEEIGTIGNPSITEYSWIIDPLDGTTNFINGIPHFAISIACIKNQRIMHAVIYDPIRREEFTACRGAGAKINNRRIRVKNNYEKSSALFGTGIPFGKKTCLDLKKFNNVITNLSIGSAGIRNTGASSLDLAYVAAGRLDAFWGKDLKPWNIAAGILMVQEAGGLISDFEGGNKYLESGQIVAGSPRAFKEALKALRIQKN